MPARIRESLVTVDYASSSAISAALAQLDMVSDERERAKKGNISANTYSGNYHNGQTNRGPPNSNSTPTAPSNFPRRPAVNSFPAPSVPSGTSAMRPNNSNVSATNVDAASAPLAGVYDNPPLMYPSDYYVSVPPPPLPAEIHEVKTNDDLNL